MSVLVFVLQDVMDSSSDRLSRYSEEHKISGLDSQKWSASWRQFFEDVDGRILRWSISILGDVLVADVTTASFLR